MIFWICLVYVLACSYVLVWAQGKDAGRLDEPKHTCVVWTSRHVQTLVNQVVVSDYELMHFRDSKEYENHIIRNLIMGLAQNLMPFVKIEKYDAMTMTFGKVFRVEVDVVERKEY
jgi:hypothetical protein